MIFPLLFSVLLAVAPDSNGNTSAELSLGAHYGRSIRDEALGMLFGGALLRMAYRDGDDREAILASLNGFFLGGAIGAAWGANTATELDEAEGSFVLDLVGVFGMGFLGGVSGYGVGAVLAPDDALAGISSLFGVVAAAPLGGVLVQRWTVSCRQPQWSVFVPTSSHGHPSLGVRATWSLP